MKYIVKHDLRRDGESYKPGDSIDLSVEKAAQCGTALESVRHVEEEEIAQDHGRKHGKHRDHGL